VSHNTILLNGTEPTARGLVAPTIACSAHYATTVSANFNSSSIGAGKARSFRFQSAGQLAAQVFPTGFSAGFSPRRNTLASTLEWYEMVNVPAGTWLAEFKIATNESTTLNGARIALYNNGTGAIVSPIITLRDRNRCTLAIAIVPGGVSYETRIISGTATTVPDLRACGVSGWTFRKIA